MNDINVNNTLLDISSEDLIREISQLETEKDGSTLKFLVNSLQSAQRCEQPSRAGMNQAFLQAKKIPLDELFILLKDSYQGKFNDHLQEILKSAELDVIVGKNTPDDPKSARHVEIRIKLAAAVIDKYADLITMALGEKTTKNQSDIIHNATKSLKKLNEQLNDVNLIYLISQMKNQCQDFIDQHKSSHCLSFFCTGKMVNKLKSMEVILTNLMIQEGLSTAEIMGGILLLDSQIVDIFGSDTVGSQLSKSFYKLLINSHFDCENPTDNYQMIQAYINRANQLEIVWPQPFDNGNAPNSSWKNQFPKWSPGLEMP